MGDRKQPRPPDPKQRKPEPPPAPPRKRSGFVEQIGALFGIPPGRHLDLAAPLYADVSRIGYDDEGLRLTLSIDSPYSIQRRSEVVSRGR